MADALVGRDLTNFRDRESVEDWGGLLLCEIALRQAFPSRGRP
jgi:hypothetical protein